MKNLTLVFLFFFVFFAHTGFAQKAIIKEIKEIAPVSKEKYVFPLIIIPGNKAASNKINTKLREDILNLDSGKYKQSIFEEVWEIKEHDGRWIYTDFSYEIFNNTNRYLSLCVTFVGGKHLQTQTYKYHFDTFTGTEFKLAELLNSGGHAWLARVIKTEQSKRIQKMIASSKDSLVKYQTLKNTLDIEYYEDVLRLYNDCLADFPSLTDVDFTQKNNRFYFTGGSCARSWNDMRVDEVGDYTFSIPLKDCMPYLSAYAKKILQMQALQRK